ncbi:MAG: polysaccharide biosynthesis tyrosine autokinase, partial [Nostocaceae cyanobacterium]|nr:polysaccharide biosynthesis tyrosine autokinase [Nostocaceae cyanobacterium]
GIQDLLKELQQQESLLAAKRTMFQNVHPDVSNLENKVAALKNLLNQRIKQVAGSEQIQSSNLQMGTIQQQMIGQLVQLESTRLGLTSQLGALSNLQNTAKKRLNILPKLGQEQRTLERKLQAAQSAYSLLAQKLQEVRLAENQNLGNAHIIAASDIPSDPATSTQTSYVAAALIAIMASMGTMYFIELKDKSVKTIDEAKKILNLTLLGVIPSFSKLKKSHRSYEDVEHNSKLIVRDTPRSPISEAFRMLRANLKFISADKELKVIVVTSSVAKEGKSTVCANLAVSMAQMEHKVLLVDADLHFPVQHQIWELHNDIGLSNTIVGQAKLKTAIKRVMPNLDVLTSGVMPPSPAALLDSKRMAALIETLAANYDLIIIDTPALNIAADAASIGQIADGVLLVVRPGVVDSVSAIFAKELLEKSGQNVLGQVVNGVIPNNEPHSYYYFADEYHAGDTMIKENVKIQELG